MLLYCNKAHNFLVHNLYKIIFISILQADPPTTTSSNKTFSGDFEIIGVDPEE